MLPEAVLKPIMTVWSPIIAASPPWPGPWWSGRLAFGSGAVLVSRSSSPARLCGWSTVRGRGKRGSPRLLVPVVLTLLTATEQEANLVTRDDLKAL